MRHHSLLVIPARLLIACTIYIGFAAGKCVAAPFKLIRFAMNFFFPKQIEGCDKILHNPLGHDVFPKAFKAIPRSKCAFDRIGILEIWGGTSDLFFHPSQTTLNGLNKLDGRHLIIVIPRDGRARKRFDSDYFGRLFYPQPLLKEYLSQKPFPGHKIYVASEDECDNLPGAEGKVLDSFQRFMRYA